MSTVLSTAKLTVELSGPEQALSEAKGASNGSDCSERLGLDPLLVMGPHSNNLDHLLFIKNRVNQSVLNINATRINSC
jgi:hypothetical protein